MYALILLPTQVDSKSLLALHYLERKGPSGITSRAL